MIAATPHTDIDLCFFPLLEESSSRPVTPRARSKDGKGLGITSGVSLDRTQEEPCHLRTGAWEALVQPFTLAHSRLMSHRCCFPTHTPAHGMAVAGAEAIPDCRNETVQTERSPRGRR